MKTSAYIPQDSLVHACSAGVKIVVLFAFSVGIFLVDTWWGMAVYAVFVALVMLASRIAVSDFLKPLLPVYVIMAFTIAFNWLVPGLFFALRILLLALMSFVVCLTTKPTDLMEAFSFALSPLRKLHVPVDDISTTLALSLRFMPLLAVEVQSVKEAQLARGAAFEGSSPVGRLKAWGNVFIPVFVGMFRKADKLAMAMDARCYGYPAQRTRLESGRFQAKDGAILALCLLILLSVAVFL